MTLPSGKTPSWLGGRGVLSLPVSCVAEDAGLATLTELWVDRALELDLGVEAGVLARQLV